MWKSAIFLAILGLLTTSLKPVFPKSRYHNYQETTVYVSETTRKEIEEELYAFFNTSSSDDALSISEQKASLSVREDLSARINSLSRHSPISDPWYYDESSPNFGVNSLRHPCPQQGSGSGVKGQYAEPGTGSGSP